MAATNRGARRGRRAKKSTPAAAKLWVAVVWVNRGLNDDPPPSLRPTGGFEAWVGAVKEDVIQVAVAKKARWDPPPFAGSLYRVLVGELVEEAHVPVTYELGPIR